MAIMFQCACGARMRAGESLAGKRARCPQCGAIVRIPTPAISEPPAEETYDLAAHTEAADDLPEPLDDPPMRSEEAVFRRTAAPSARPRSTPPAPASTGASPLEHLYLLLALALIPLGLTLLAKEEQSVKDRLAHTMERASPEVVAQVEKVMQSEENASLDNLLAALPGGRLDETAHLPRQTLAHWLYAALASGVFLAFVVFLFPGESRNPVHLFLIGLFTGTIGIILLLAVQYLAGATGGVWIRSRSVPVLVFFYLAKFIGFSYASANDPSSNLLLSFVGFTCGVGLCEELCKALPLIGNFRRSPTLGWRGACLWGLASGIGFGVSEGVMYSASYYNGISSASMYVVRFVSCVALHAVWSASVGITVWRRQDSIQGDMDWPAYSLALLRILAVPMILHGLYDTLLKKDMEPLALAVGMLSFVYFVWQVESARGSSEGAVGRLRRA